MENWKEAYKNNTGLLLFGDVGTGKSFFAGCIANALLDREMCIRDSTDIGVALDFAKEAVKIAPVYYVTGNHEASLSQYDELKIELKTIGVIEMCIRDRNTLTAQIEEILIRELICS